MAYEPTQLADDDSALEHCDLAVARLVPLGSTAGSGCTLVAGPGGAARVNVPDDRFRWLCDLYKPKSQVPAFLEIVDIAGLVKGAAGGEGLGNAFLSHIAAVDGIFHVCRG